MRKAGRALAVPWMLCTACSAFNPNHVLDATFEVLPAEVATAGQVGTAFALDDGTYVSAAHVLNGIIGSRYDRPFLLGRNSVQYPIEDIVRYSQRQDFVVFSARALLPYSAHPPEHAQLTPREGGPQPGEMLYIAGHSSTEKRIVVVPATSDSAPTGEAARSPFPLHARIVTGMSGGPVIDERGEVLGLLRRRDALGIAAALAPRASADIGMSDVVEALNLYEYAGILGSPERGVFDPALMAPDDGAADIRSPATIPLDRPMPYPEFAARVVALRQAWFERTLGMWIRNPKRRVLAAGESAKAACELLNDGPCREVPATARDAQLALEAPRVAGVSREGPTVYTAMFDGVRVVRRRSPHARAAVEKICSAGPQMQRPAQLALQMDERWQSKRGYRLEPGAEEPYTDGHGRTWSLCTWPVKEQDMQLIALARPCPQGYLALVRLVPTALTYAATLHMKAIASIDSVVAPETRSGPSGQDATRDASP